MPQHSPMVIAAARELCKRACEVSQFEFEPWWATYREDYIADAQAAFDAAGVGELVEALAAVFKLVDDGWLVRNTMHDDKPGFGVRQIAPLQSLAKAQAALTRATGA